MRKCLVIALAVSSLVSAASFAGAQSAAAGTSRAEMRAVHSKKGRHNGLFRGVKLSADEKARIKDVRGKYRADNLKLRQSTMSAMQQARAARQKGDTSGARAILAGTRANRDAMRASMLRERNEIRSSLSAENQKQFDANSARFAKRHKGFIKKHQKPGETANG